MSGYNYIAKMVKGGIALWKKHQSHKIHINKSKIRRLTFALSDLDIRIPCAMQEYSRTGDVDLGDVEMKEIKKIRTPSFDMV
jgi:hypothetical protein